jgi:hypothetical protein
MQYVAPSLSVLGAIIAAALTFWATSYKEKVRWLRSEDTRLGEIRRNAYARYAAAQKLDMVTCRRMAAGLGLYDSASNITEDEGLARLTELRDDRNVSYENLRLIGSEEVVTAAREWHDSVLPLRKFARNEPNARAIPFSDLYRRAGEASFRFYEKARADLGVSGVVSRPNADEMLTAEE